MKNETNNPKGQNMKTAIKTENLYYFEGWNSTGKKTKAGIPISVRVSGTLRAGDKADAHRRIEDHQGATYLGTTQFTLCTGMSAPRTLRSMQRRGIFFK